MSLTDVSYRLDNIVKELFTSFDQEQVENIFNKYQVEDYQECINLMRKYMKTVDTSNTSEDIFIEDEYQDEIGDICQCLVEIFNLRQQQ
jgi:hypothetical protein